MISKFINPVLWFGRTQGKKSGAPDNQAVAGTPPLVPVIAGETPFSEIRKTIDGPVVTFEGTYQGQPIRVRIFNAPTQEPNLDLK